MARTIKQQQSQSTSTTQTKTHDVKVTISAPSESHVTVRIVGTAPLVVHAFSEKAARTMAIAQEGGPKAKKKEREARDPEAEFKAATYRLANGRPAFPVPGLMAAMVRACQLGGFKMVAGKSVFVIESDDIDPMTMRGMFEIKGPEPEMFTSPVRIGNGTTTDLRYRPAFKKWYADIRIRWDETQFTLQDVLNLITRAGLQVGLGEGRMLSKNSVGCGWGSFKVDEINPDLDIAPEGF